MDKEKSLSILVRVFNSDLPEQVIFNLQKGERYPKNFDLGFFAPLAIIEIFPNDFVNTSAITDVSP